MSPWEAVTWDVARAGGFTAYVLLGLSVALGLALTMHWQSWRWPRLINSELHNFVTLLSLVFTGIHVLAVWLDPFTRFGWSEVFIPFVSHYRPLWMALGIVALYLGLAIGLSTWLRPLIGYAWWRRLHALTLVSYAMVTVHGIATGSDTRTWWGGLIYAGSALVIAGLLIVRLYKPATKQARAHPLWAGMTAGLVVTGAAWALLGPGQPGWNASANNGNGSGARIPVAAAASSGSSSSSSTAPFGAPFTAQVQGTLSQSGPDSSGAVTYDLTGTLSNGATGHFELRMSGQQDSAFGENDGGVTITTATMTLGTSDTPALYQGQVTQLRTDDGRWRIMATLGQGSAASQTLVIQLRLSVSGGTVQGTIQGTPQSSAGSGL
jgi:hypothetical protein